MESSETSEEVKQETFDLLDYGCKNQSLEFYTNLGTQFSEMDILDRLRIVDVVLKNLFNSDNKLHPVVMRMMMEKLQEIEIKSAMWKKMLGDTKIVGLNCSKCKNTYPTMTLEQLCVGVNSVCPHDEIEVTFDE